MMQIYASYSNIELEEDKGYNGKGEKPIISQLILALFLRKQKLKILENSLSFDNTLFLCSLG